MHGVFGKEPVAFGEVFGFVGGGEAAAPLLGVVFIGEAGGVGDGLDEYLAVASTGRGVRGGRG